MHPQQLLDVKREVRRAHSNALRIKVASALNRALPWTWTPSARLILFRRRLRRPGAGLPNEKARNRKVPGFVRYARRSPGGSISCGTPIRRGW